MKRKGIYFLLCILLVFSCLWLNCRNSKISNVENDSAFIERLIYSYEEIHKTAVREFDSFDDNSKIRLIPYLIKALNYKKAGDRNAVVYRYRAADAIGRIGPSAKEAIPHLIQALKYDESHIVRNHVGSALGKVGLEPTQIPILIEAFKDNEIWGTVSHVLGEMGEAAIPFLIEALKDKNEWVSMGAANALGIMGPKAKETAPALLQAMRNSDEKYRHSYAGALEKIGSVDVESISILIQDLKNKDERIRLIALEALVEKGKASVPGLIQVLRGQDDDVRFWAIYAIGRIGPKAKEAVPEIINCINDKNEFVRGNAIWALKEIDPSSARNTLKSLNDISDEELTAVSKMIQGPKDRMNKNSYPQDTTVMIHAIERLERLIKHYTSSLKMDQMLFMLGNAKILMANLIDAYKENKKVKEFYEKHQSDYYNVIGITLYEFNDFLKLINDYPNSPLAAEATFIIAKEKNGIRDCEGDLDCEISASIDYFLPFIKRYPTNQRIREAVGYINSDLQFLTDDPKIYGFREIFDIESTGKLLNDFFEVVMNIPDLDIRAGSLYALARAFISTGQYDKAYRIYKDLEANYPKYSNARTMTAYQMFDYSNKVPKGKQLSEDKLHFYTNQLNDKSEENRLKALNKIRKESNFDRPLLFSVLLAVGNILIKDESPTVRKQALEVISELAPKTSFFNSAVGTCILHDPDSKNRYYCAMLGKANKDLKEINFYLYHYKDKIDQIISE